MSEENKKEQAPAIGPYFFPVLLGMLGLWCVYDGWFTTDPEMMKHQLFNQIMGVLLFPWALIDMYRTWKSESARKAGKTMDKSIQKK